MRIDEDTKNEENQDESRPKDVADDEFFGTTTPPIVPDSSMNRAAGPINFIDANKSTSPPVGFASSFISTPGS